MLHTLHSGPPEIFKHEGFNHYETEKLEEKYNVLKNDGRQKRIHSSSLFAYEWIRRATFDSWPVDYVNKDDLAKAGFFYLRTGDLVQCYFCKGVVGYWERGDRPFTEHEKHFPGCPFVQGTLTPNIPIASSEEGEKSLNHFLNDYLQHALEHQKPPIPSNRLQTDAISLGQVNKFAYPACHSLKTRLYSLRNWPKINVPPAERVAEAGFFYTGISDFVLCFCCGGGLFNWTKDDDPLRDHLQHYGHCSFFKSETKKENNEFSLQTKALSQDEEQLLLQYPMSRKLLEMGLSSYSIKGALKEFLERHFYLPGTFMKCTDVVVEWDERQKHRHADESLEMADCRIQETKPSQTETSKDEKYRGGF